MASNGNRGAPIMYLGTASNNLASTTPAFFQESVETFGFPLRTERLWRDLWVAVTSIYFDVLYCLEEEGFLNIASVGHLFCCHYVFLPHLQDDLDTFRSGWDNHPIRMESHMTPNHLWVLCGTNHPIPGPENTAVMDVPDIEWEKSGLPLNDHLSILVRGTEYPLTDEQMAALRDAVNPRAESQSFGCDIFSAAVRFCEQFLSL